jgi:hypothetical protein
MPPSPPEARSHGDDRYESAGQRGAKPLRKKIKAADFLGELFDF